MSREPDRIDQKSMARSFGRASTSYDAAADLQATARKELLSRLDHFHLEPHTIVDLGAGTGLATVDLRQRFPYANILSIDIAFPMLNYAQRRQANPTGWMQLRAALRGLRAGRSTCITANASALPLRNGSVQLVFSNLMLQWCLPPDDVLAEVRRVLAPGGLFLCSTFGPTTLNELRSAWAMVDDQPHVNEFVDMHDLGSAMGRTGLTEPVLDMDRLYKTYPRVNDLLRELKDLGAGNSLSARRRGLTGKERLAQMIKNYERLFSTRASWEIIYGSAFAPTATVSSIKPRSARQDHSEISVPLESLGRRPPRKSR